MTNEYGSDSQPQEHEEQEVSHEAPAHEGEPGVWTDDQPPHDDFGSANEETATASQEAATEAEAEETAAPEQRQSRSMLPILAGLGGILVLGGVLYLQFGHSSPSSQPLHLTSSPAAQGPAETSSPTASTTTNSAETDINSLYKPAGTPTPINMPSSSTPIETMPSPSPSPLPPQGSAPPTPTNAATSPTSSMASVPEAAKPQSSAMPVNTNGTALTQPQANPANPPPPMPGQVLRPQMPSNVPFTGTASSNEHFDAQQLSRLNALSAHLDTLQRSLDQVTNMVAAVPNATNRENSDVEVRLNKIEQTLTKIESGQAANTAKRMASSAAASESPAEVPRATHSTRTSSSRHKRHAKPVSSSHHKPVSTASRAETMSSHSPWVLRAATPKEAWVSTDATSPDLRHVQIGESLPGIGVIRSIRQVNGGWEIEGSTGVIR